MKRILSIFAASILATTSAQAIEIEVVPELADQENRSKRVKSVFYWEGAVKVVSSRGERLGKGYVELVGYGSGSRPRI